MIDFAENLKRKRIEKGVTQKELADNVGIVQGSICYYEKGQRKPSIEVAIKLADYFNITIDELLKGVRK